MTGNRRDAGRVDYGMRRIPWLAATLVLFATACARTGGGAPADPRPAFDARARLVANAWSAAVAAPAWRDGLVPLADLTIVTGADLTAEQEYALGAGRFAAALDLPGDAPPDGTVRAPGGGARRVPLISARTAFTDMRRDDAACPPGTGPVSPPAPQGTGPDGSVGAPAVHDCTVLTITAATLGSTPLRTNRGTVTVPAWIFTVPRLPGPVARVAVAPGTLARAPEVPVPAADTAASFVGAHRLNAADGERLTFTIGTGACQEGAAGLVHETDDVVVIGGDPGRATAGPCIGSLAYRTVTVTVTRPLGGRPVVDAVTGRLLPATRSPW